MAFAGKKGRRKTVTAIHLAHCQLPLFYFLPRPVATREERGPESEKTRNPRFPKSSRISTCDFLPRKSIGSQEALREEERTARARTHAHTDTQTHTLCCRPLSPIQSCMYHIVHLRDPSTATTGKGRLGFRCRPCPRQRVLNVR